MTTDDDSKFRPIRFLDLKENNDAERRRLKDEEYSLKLRKQENHDRLPPELEKRLQELNGLIQRKVVDPVYIRARDLLAGLRPPKVEDPTDGLYPREKTDTLGNLKDGELALAAVYGLLSADNITNTASDRFTKAVSSAHGEYIASKALIDAVLKILANEGLTWAWVDTEGHLYLDADEARKRDEAAFERREMHVRAHQWVAVARALRDDGVPANDPLLPIKARQALASALGVDEGAAPSSIAIDLPDLEAPADVEIQVDNLLAAQVFYFAAKLEDMRLWHVVEKLVELFRYGMLPIGRGRAGDYLYKYWKSSATRIDDFERRSLYSRIFGFPGGDADQNNVNREYNDLWLRFVSAVSSLVRQYTVDNLLKANIPVNISQEQVRKAGRDLAANLSLHAYGIAYFAGTEIQQTINEFIALLSDPEIKAAYGARDMYQVIDQINTLELDGPRNTIRHRTEAQAGAIIIAWLAKKADKLAGARMTPVIDFSEVRAGIGSSKPIQDPTDYDLVSACEQWLAVTGMPDDNVEQYAQPVESPNMTSAPIHIPNVARDMLASVGVQAGGRVNGGGYRNGNGASGGAGRGYGRY